MPFARRCRYRRRTRATARRISSAISRSYPTQPGAAYIPPAASFEDLCVVEKTLGFERFVIVHSTLYGPDHRLAVDVLEALPDRSHVRLIARVDDSTSDKEIEKLHALGACGVRFGFRHDLPRPLSLRHRDAHRRNASRRSAGICGCISSAAR